MVKYYNFDVVFAEIPDETTLALNITNCPNRCRGCHSPHLQEDIGKKLDEEELRGLIRRYGRDITCICFMGGDADPSGIDELAGMVRKISPELKTGWYSGRPEMYEGIHRERFDYIKLGPWNENAGPLNSRSTNQRLYRIQGDSSLKDITFRFWKDYSL